MQAWLGLTPDEAASLTNWDLYPDTTLPYISDRYSHLPEYLEYVGVCGVGYSGLVPITFAEINAWAYGQGLDLDWFESTCLQAMSASYAAIANNKDTECPIEDDQIQEEQNKANISSWIALSRPAEKRSQ